MVARFFRMSLAVVPTVMAVGVLALSVLTPAPARADDPKDPAMRSAAARARDHALTRQLNQAELARVRERDAGYAVGWASAREQDSKLTDHAARVASHQQAMADYEDAEADYAARMAQWRRQVAACQGGDWNACR